MTKSVEELATEILIANQKEIVQSIKASAKIVNIDTLIEFNAKFYSEIHKTIVDSQQNESEITGF